MTDPIALTAKNIWSGPYSEYDLEKSWDAQADAFNKWDSLDLDEQLAWAQTQAITHDRIERQRQSPANGKVAELDKLRDELKCMASQAVDGCRFEDAENLSRAAELLRAVASPQPLADGKKRNLTGNIHWIDSLISLKQSKLSKLRSENERIFSRLKEKQMRLSQIEKLTDAQVIRPVKRLKRLAPLKPIPMSKRPPKATDCDAEGRCWQEEPGTATEPPAWNLVHRVDITERAPYGRWLPAHALPIPSEEKK